MDHVDGQIALTKDVPDIHLCRRCGRKLTSAKRIKAGIGYCCAKNEEDDGMKNDAVIEQWVCSNAMGDTLDGEPLIVPYSTDANLWFGPDGLLTHAAKAFGSTWIIASLRMSWEQGPRLWADTLAKMIEEAGDDDR